MRAHGPLRLTPAISSGSSRGDFLDDGARGIAAYALVHVKRITRREHYSSWEIDDMLLGHFEDIGNLERKRIIDFHLVYANFDWFIEFTWKNRHMQAYIQYQRTEYPDYADLPLWSAFEYIAKKCQEYSELSPGPCRWWWLLKRNLLRISPK